MRFKKVIIVFLLIFAFIVIYLVVYNKTYQINVNTNEVYEILIKTAYPYEEKKLTDKEEINKYLATVKELQFTHPSFNTGKGWETYVTIKSRNSKGIDKDYNYTITNDYIQKGSFRYKLILK